jgi:hypothetical protein
MRPPDIPCSEVLQITFTADVPDAQRFACFHFLVLKYKINVLE